MRLFALLSTAIAVSACGTSAGGTTGGTSGGTSGGAHTHTVILSSDGGFGSFSPANVTVKAGDTIQWINVDAHNHDAISESAANAFDGDAGARGGWAFASGTITSDGTAVSITVPSTVASGTVQPYFCSFHKAAMTVPNPTITIQ